MRKLELAVSCLNTHTHRQRQTHNVIEVIKLLDTGVLQTCRFLAHPGPLLTRSQGICEGSVINSSRP